ncbi:MAG: protein-L-isoaspartate(D-aspartate) O-methyltransferase [Planctomycetota bacterium]|nr:protein-L-isoaspartate(D-aspartate) O-methyltransferase [Planctomycetota bacterium]
MAKFEQARETLISQLRSKGIRDERVLAVLGRTRRERFVSPKFEVRTYEDGPLPIEHGQTISQPYMVALMTECLELTGDESVLEIGTGSGYQSAVLAQLCREVVTIERFESLSATARDALRAEGHRNIRFELGDGTIGVREFAPYDAIIVTAAAPRVPESLYQQLKLTGRMVIPTGGADVQTLQVVEKRSAGPSIRDICGCRFVKLIGAEGWQDHSG